MTLAPGSFCTVFEALREGGNPETGGEVSVIQATQSRSSCRDVPQEQEGGITIPLGSKGSRFYVWAGCEMKVIGTFLKFLFKILYLCFFFNILFYM